MRYFAYVVDQAFKTAPTGERLFYRGGPWSAPYVIPDDTTEARLYRKRLWTYRILGTVLILGQPLLFLWRPDLLTEPYRFVAYLLATVAAFWLIDFAVLAPDLEALQRAPRLPARSFYGQMASRHSKSMLVLAFIGCVVFAAAGVWIAEIGLNRFLGIACAVVFGVFAVAWAYALRLKLADGKRPM